MSLEIKCDRCRETIDPVSLDQFNSAHLPSGWECVCGADLCPTCSIKLHRFLANGPIVDRINLNARVWVTRGGKVHPYQLWDLMHIYGPRLTLSNTEQPQFEGNVIYFEEPRP